MIITETHRLYLREFQQQDAQELVEILCDPIVMFYSLSGPVAIEKLSSWIEVIQEDYRRHGYGLWAIILKEESRLIGLAGLSIENIYGQKEIALGYKFARAYWRQGFATEAAIVVRDYAFCQLRIRKLIAIIHAENYASIAVALKLGMRHQANVKIGNLPAQLYSVTDEVCRHS